MDRIVRGMSYEDIKNQEMEFNKLRKDILSSYSDYESLLVNGREDLINIFINQYTSNNMRGYICELFYELVLLYMKHTLSEEGIQSDYVSDLIIPSLLGGSQLDHIFVTQRNIYCIECKSIFGKMNISEGEIIPENRDSIFKPWKQNNTHIFALKNILEMKDYVHNIVGLFSVGRINDIKLNKKEYLMTPTTATKLLYSFEQKNGIAKYKPDKITAYLSRFKATTTDKFEHLDRLEKMYYMSGDENIKQCI